MTTIRRSHERGHADHGWVKTYHTARLSRGDSVEHKLPPERHARIHVAEGEVTLNGQALKASDSTALTDETRVVLAAKQSAQLLLFDLA